MFILISYFLTFVLGKKLKSLKVFFYIFSLYSRPYFRRRFDCDYTHNKYNRLPPPPRGLQYNYNTILVNLFLNINAIVNAFWM